MKLAHLHAPCGNAPLGTLEIELRPLREPKLARPNEGEWQKLQGELGGDIAFVARDCPHQLADPGRIDDGRTVTPNDGGDRAAEVPGRGALRSTGHHRIAEDVP